MSKFKFDDIDQCATCIDVNIRKNSPGKRSLSETVSCPYQGLFVDFAFAARVSTDKEGKVIESSREDIEGFNGETAWVLITDAQTNMIHGDTRTSKASPLKYLESFLEEYSPNVSNKFVVMDQGGEFYRNPEIRNLFAKYKYKLFPTGADSSSSNGAVERAHRTVATSARALLFGANSPVKFWPYAFHHVLRIRNAIPHRGQEVSRLFLSTTKKDNFTKFRTFGCRVHVRPPGVRSKRFKNEARKGIFLGYLDSTSRVIIFYDESSNRIKYATHAKFHEGFNDLPSDNLPPNCQQILRQNGSPLPMDNKEISTPDLKFFLYPFADKEIATIPVLPSNKDSSFGFKLQDDDLFGRSYIKEIFDNKSSSAAKVFGNITRSRPKLRGAFITHVNGVPVFSTILLISGINRVKRTTLREHAIDDNNRDQRSGDGIIKLTPGTTKRIKSKDGTNKEVELNTAIDDNNHDQRSGDGIIKFRVKRTTLREHISIKKIKTITKEVHIMQARSYREMSCANYLRRLLKSHERDTESSKSIPSEMVSTHTESSKSIPSEIEMASTPASNSDSNNVDASDTVDTSRVCSDNDFDAAAATSSVRGIDDFDASCKVHKNSSSRMKSLNIKNNHDIIPKTSELGQVRKIAAANTAHEVSLCAVTDSFTERDIISSSVIRLPTAAGGVMKIIFILPSTTNEDGDDSNRDQRSGDRIVKFRVRHTTLGDHVTVMQQHDDLLYYIPLGIRGGGVKAKTKARFLQRLLVIDDNQIKLILQTRSRTGSLIVKLMAEYKIAMT